MNPIVVGTVVFACSLGGALVGMWLSTILPEPHLNKKSEDAVKLGIGLIATMTALVLSLVMAIPLGGGPKKMMARSTLVRARSKATQET